MAFLAIFFGTLTCADEASALKCPFQIMRTVPLRVEVPPGQVLSSNSLGVADEFTFHKVCSNSVLNDAEGEYVYPQLTLLARPPQELIDEPQALALLSKVRWFFTAARTGIVGSWREQTDIDVTVRVNGDDFQRKLAANVLRYDLLNPIALFSQQAAEGCFDRFPVLVGDSREEFERYDASFQKPRNALETSICMRLDAEARYFLAAHFEWPSKHF